ncbi:hypothetical protein J1N35_039279 [Gossypium stocksii]|uniref:Uncharacterized protein n=1 Tax=Gossypium stocksii TaxID=47602 RepID=A0A9D3UP09_9ROSI|nr:hypothetical protein J1N35_039279 [Gossypium stocksii]
MLEVHTVQEASFHAHLIEAPSSTMVNSAPEGCPPAGCGRGFRSRVQCQICGRFGHLVQWCYYHFNRDYGGPTSGTKASSSSGFVCQGLSMADVCGSGTSYAIVLPRCRSLVLAFYQWCHR